MPRTTSSRVIPLHSNPHYQCLISSFSTTAQTQHDAVTLKDHYGLYIDGQFQPSTPNSESFSVENPATKQPLCTVTSAQPQDVAFAIDCAHNAFTDGRWSRKDVRGTIIPLVFYSVLELSH